MPEIHGSFTKFLGGTANKNEKKIVSEGALAIAFENSTGYYWYTHGGSMDLNTVTFNASKSNTVYGSSSTVQPPAIVLVPQIRF